MLTVIADHPHFTSSGHADRYAIFTPHLLYLLVVMPDPPHALPIGRADRYAVSS